MKKRIYVFLVVIFISVESFAQDEFTIGYIDNSLFHPMLKYIHGTLLKTEYDKFDIPKWVKKAFQKTDSKIKLSDPIKYSDIYTEEPGFYGKTHSPVSENRGYFYANIEKPLINLRFQERDKVIHNFYEFFSNDNWGKHFIPKSLLDESIDEIYQETGVIIHYVTDIDKDAQYELWISYKLTYGEIGRMVYEQAGDSKWISISNHCFNCD